MFVGRNHELEILEQCYQSEKFECLILYGRRRVGKTALIREFVHNKRCIFFTGIETTADENLNMFSQSIYQCDHESGEWPIYPSFDAAFKAIADMSNNQNLVLVLDEYPYLAKSYPAISSILQKKYRFILPIKSTLNVNYLRFVHVIYGTSSIGISKSAVWSTNRTA